MDGFARATSAGTSTRRVTYLWPRLVGCAAGSMAGPAAAMPGRLEAAVSMPEAGAAAASSTATSSAARFGLPKGAPSSSTSAGGAPDPHGATVAEAGVPGAKNLRTPALDAPGGLRTVSFETDPGPSPVGSPRFGVNLLAVLKLGRFLQHMSFDMLMNDGSKSKIRVGAVRLSHNAEHS